MKKYLVLIFLAVLLNTFSTLVAQDEDVDPVNVPSVIVQGDNGLSLILEYFTFVPEFENYRPYDNSSVVMIVFAKLVNNSSNRECVRARRVRLYLDDREYAPQNGAMDAVKLSLIDTRDFIGAYSGQCADANTSNPTFIAFEVPLSQISDIRIAFWDNSVPIEVEWPTEIENRIYVFGVQEDMLQEVTSLFLQSTLDVNEQDSTTDEEETLTYDDVYQFMQDTFTDPDELDIMQTRFGIFFSLYEFEMTPSTLFATATILTSLVEASDYEMSEEAIVDYAILSYVPGVNFDLPGILGLSAAFLQVEYQLDAQQ